MDRAVLRERQPDPHLRLLDLSGGAEHVIGGARAWPRATLTTLYLAFEKEAEAALGLPTGAHSCALLPIGYPMGRFGPVRRISLSEAAFEDRWGQPYRDKDRPP